MVFRILGQLVRRAWPLLLAGWGLLLLVTWRNAPPWHDVAQDKEFAFLPKDVPSRAAEAVYAKAFPDDRRASTIVLVLYRADNASGHLQRDLKFIEDVLEPGLRKIADADGGLASTPAPSDDPLFGPKSDVPQAPPRRSIMWRIRTPNAPGSGALLVSPDGKALMVIVELTTELLSSNNWPTLTRIEDLIGDLRHKGQLPPGSDIAVTGSAAIGRDHTLGQLQSARATGILTIVLVIGLLIVIYRAPLLAAIPLLTVYLAVQVALNLLAILARDGFITLFAGIEIYITILAYGAGVDYSLFLTARYKEELDRGASPADAVAGAVGGVGAALTASAATVICGIAMMLFAQFGKFHEAGFAIPLSLVLVLCATLTFSAALLRLAGLWAFWPYQPKKIAGDASTPAPRRGVLQGGELQWIWEHVGRLVLRRPATVWLLAVAVMAPFVVTGGLLYNHLSYDLIGNLPADAPSVAGTRVLQEHFPAGVMGPVDVLLVNGQVDFGSAAGGALIEQVTAQLRKQMADLGLADVRSLTVPLGVTKAAGQSFAGIPLPADVVKEGARHAALEYYVTSLGERARIGTRLELILAQSPFSHRSMEALDHIEEAIRSALPQGKRQDTRLYVVGTTASVRDLAVVIQGDRTRIELLVLASVLLILILLLRRLVVPVYLLLSVLFSYYATLGVSFAVFWLLDPEGFTGIDWRVAIFLFTILIAVGEDYNIFLITRIHEEQRVHGLVQGIPVALTRTGPIISSCGIIMAGTFASLLAGSLTEMKQLGFALAFGVLLDTFIVRPILVPAFLVLLETGRLSLRRRTPPHPAGAAEVPSAVHTPSST